MIRNPMHAGTFYPRFGEQIKKLITSWLEDAPQPPANERSLGLILPHAGYMYSGKCAALGLHSLSTENIDTFVILHPCHSGYHFDYSLSPFAEYTNPLGSLMLDSELYQKLAGDADQSIALSYHQNEHSMEIQLPLVSHFFPHAKILPIMIGNQIPAVAKRLATALYDMTTRSSKRIVVLCSTDLSHYHNAAKAEAMDSTLLNGIIALEPDRLWQDLNSGKCEACGIGGIMALMHLAKMYSTPRVEVVDYTHSGRVSGNDMQVVGYLSARIVI